MNARNQSSESLESSVRDRIEEQPLLPAPSEGQSSLRNYRIYSYDKAMRMTINRKQVFQEDAGPCKRCCSKITCGATFQAWFVAIFILQCLVPILIEKFLPLFEHNACTYECLSDEDGQWHECEQEEICAKGLPSDKYRANQNDPEYLDNWSQQYELTCDDKYLIGLIGSMYYIGMLCFIVVVPMIADKYGRKLVFTINYIIFILSTVGILFANDLIWLYVFLFISGATIGGRSVVGINYMLEFQQAKKKNLAIFLRLMAYSILIIVYTAIFEQGTRKTKIVLWISLFITILCTIYIAVFVPESPQYLCERGIQEDYDESRDILDYIARFNGVSIRKSMPYKNFKFVEEAQKNNQSRPSALIVETLTSNEDIQSDNKSIREGAIYNEDQAYAERNYVMNICKMTVMWTAANFSGVLLQYLNKYLSGTIFLNFYIEGAAGIVGFMIGKILNYLWKTKISFIVSYVVTILGAIFIFLFEGDYITPYAFGSCDCTPFPHESPQDKKYHLDNIIPWFTFIAKIGTNITYSAASYASFSDPTIFPLLKRSTAVGICDLFAIGITIFAPFVAELDKPIPILVVIFISIIGLAVSFTFQGRRERKKSV